MNILDVLKFIARYIANPSRTGAVCPSSRFLASEMANTVGSLKEGDIIVELGAGTGAITSSLSHLAKKNGAILYSIEFDTHLAEILKARFPNINVINDSAENIANILGAENLPKIKAIVSCLPLLSLPEDCVKNIISAVEDSMPAKCRFSQFTYKLTRKPSELGFKNLTHISNSIVLLNIPPARVDIFEKP